MRGEAAPVWASWLGIATVVLGVLLAAERGTEWMKQAVIANATPASGQLPDAVCPEDELIEEGLSAAECEQLVANVRNYIVSAPSWFPGVQTLLAATATILALVSIGVGASLLEGRAWAPGAAMSTLGALALVDAAGFVAAVNAGPILRDVYLWGFLLWFFIHLMMTIGVAVGRAEVKRHG